MFLKIINLVKAYQYHLFLLLCLSLVSFIGFNLGKINALQKSPLKVRESGSLKIKDTDLKADIYSATTKQQQTTENSKKLDTRVVVSKASASKKYHYSWCASASKIKEENKLWFNSAEEAESVGYALAGNCSK